MQVKFVMFKGAQRKDFDLTGDTTIIGRRDDCGLRIPSNDVSRAHCQVAVKDNQVVVKDLGSSNGTFVNDRRVTEAPLRPGDVLRVGPVAFTVQINGKPAQIVSPDELAAAMGDDDSGLIPELEMEEVGAKSPPAAAAESNDDDPLAGLDMLELDEDDFEIEDKGKA